MTLLITPPLLRRRLLASRALFERGEGGPGRRRGATVLCHHWPLRKHGKPCHRQTRGKVERYHQTLKKWLRKQPAASSIEELQRQIDGFVHTYNEVRPHQARGCPPMHAWRTLDKATPTLAGQKLLAKTRVRHDRVDDTWCVTLQYRRTLHHISLGRRYRGQRVIKEGGELIRHFTLNPSKDYQPRRDD